MPGWVREWPFRITDLDRLLSRRGVERSAVSVVATLKTMNLVQAALVLSLGLGISSRPWLEVVALIMVATSGILVVVTGFRANRLLRWPIATDVAVAAGVLLIAPLFQAHDPVRVWADWPIFVTFLIASEAAVVFPWHVATACTGVLMGGALTWLLYSPSPATRTMVTGSLVGFVGFSAVAGAFLLYLRKLSSLADDRGKIIRQLEEERTRRVLHTPYRLLNDLAVMLRREAAQDGDDVERSARLAEAVASVQEIESVVRGTEPASSNLAADLRRLQDQFVDLPLLMNVEDASRNLPPAAVYRLREAVRSALQNVRRHADAGQVVVYATTDEQSWLVSVYDDGKGIGPDARRGVGTTDLMIGAMEEIGATVAIDSAPGQGTLVEFTGGYEWSSGRVSS